MLKTAVIFSPKYYRHDPGEDHPESAERLRAIISELKTAQFSYSRKWRFVEPEEARIEDVTLVHDIEYVKHVKAVCKSGGGLMDSGDTLVCPESFDVALYAVGGALKAVKLVMGEQYENAFALVRPPGHHAERFRALGFCIFNNVAIATECLLRKFKLRRILIFDIDTHHGNGTQQTFYDTDEVLYISLHEDPREFPGTGFIDEVGEGRGLGYTVNIPFPFRTDDQIYLKAVREIVTPIVRQYKPQFILVSAGFDGHYTDPVGRLSLSALSYSEVFAAILNLASETCGGRLVSVLEGGYSSEFVGVMAASTIARMSGNPCVVSDQILPARRKVRIQAEEVLEEVKKVQRSFWDIY